MQDNGDGAATPDGEGPPVVSLGKVRDRRPLVGGCRCGRWWAAGGGDRGGVALSAAGGQDGRDEDQASARPSTAGRHAPILPRSRRPEDENPSTCSRCSPDKRRDRLPLLPLSVE